MAKIPVVLMDLDGVVVDFDQGLCKRLRPLVQQPNASGEGHAVDPEDPAAGCIVCERKTFRISNPRWKAEAHRIMTEPDFFLRLRPYRGAKEVIQRLLERTDIMLFFCSSPVPRSPVTAKDKTDWVREHFGVKGEQRLILAHDKTIIRGDVLVDANPDPTGHFGASPEWKHLVFCRSYNKEVCGTVKPFLAYWDEMEDELADMLPVDRMSV